MYVRELQDNHGNVHLSCTGNHLLGLQARLGQQKQQTPYENAALHRERTK